MQLCIFGFNMTTIPHISTTFEQSTRKAEAIDEVEIIQRFYLQSMLRRRRTRKHHLVRVYFYIQITWMK